MYLSIKKLVHQWLLAQGEANDAMSEMLAGLGLEYKAALHLGHNTAEYDWVSRKLRTAKNLGPLMIALDRDNAAMLMDIRDTLIFKAQNTTDLNLRSDYEAAIEFVALQIERAGRRRTRAFEAYPGIDHNFSLYRQFAREIEKVH